MLKFTLNKKPIFMKLMISSFLLSFFIFSFFIFNLAEALSISSDNKLACQLFLGNKYYLIDLEKKKILKKTQLDNYYDGAFFLSSDKIILQKIPNLYILDAILLKKEKEFSFSEEIKKVLTIREDTNKIYFVIFTNYSIRYFVYDKNNQTIRLLKQKPLIKFNDVILKDNLLFLANNTNVSIFKPIRFLWINSLTSKNINLKDVVYSLDIGKNKFLVLHYISKEKRKIAWYTKEGMIIKDIILDGKYYKIFFSFDEKEAVLFDQTNSIKTLSFNGEIKESSIMPQKILEMEKTQDGWILFIENENFVILDKELNTVYY